MRHRHRETAPEDAITVNCYGLQGSFTVERKRMLVAKVIPSGAEVTYTHGSLLLDGASISPEKLTEYDELGVLDWAGDELRSLTLRLDSERTSPSVANPTGEQPTTDTASKGSVLAAIARTAGVALALACIPWVVVFSLDGRNTSLVELLSSFLLSPLPWLALVFAYIGDRAAKRRGSNNKRHVYTVVGILAATLIVGIVGGAVMGVPSLSANVDYDNHLGGVTPEENRLFLGSTEGQVISVLGEPDSVEGAEWIYREGAAEQTDAAVPRKTATLYVYDGQLLAYEIEPAGAALHAMFGADAIPVDGKVGSGDAVGVALGKLGTPTEAWMPFLAEDGVQHRGGLLYYQKPSSPTRVPGTEVVFYGGRVEAVE
jgi:hypothetical protein